MDNIIEHPINPALYLLTTSNLGTGKFLFKFVSKGINFNF